MEHKTTANTTMFANGERLLNPRSAARTILRSKCSGNLPYSPTGAFSLDGEYHYESIPRGITDGFCEMVILEQSGDVQILNCDFIELPDDSISDLVEVVAPLIGDLLMDAPKQVNVLTPIRPSHLSLADLSLCNLQSTLGHSKELRVFDYFSGRKSSKIFYPNVDTDALAGLRNKGTVSFIDQKDCIPTVSLPFDGDISNLSLNGTRETQTDRTELRQSELITFKPEALLSISKRVISIPRFEAWKSRFLTFQASLKEGVVGTGNSTQAFLENHRIVSVDIRAFSPDILQLKILRKEVNASTGYLPAVPPFLERSIVKLTAKIKNILEPDNDSLRGSADFEFISFHGPNELYPVTGCSTRSL